MPSTLSKLKETLMLEWSFPYNCYEIGHSWDPSCTASSLDLSLEVAEKGIKMYSALYLFQFLVGRNYSLDSAQRALINTLRSSAFLGFNCLTMFSLVCFLRKVTGKFYFTLFATVPATLGSLMAIFIEHPSRRKALAFYCANIASECLFRISTSRGFIKPLAWGGDTALFTLSISLLLYICSEYGLKRDPIGLALKLILGRSEFYHRGLKSRKGRNPQTIYEKASSSSSSLLTESYPQESVNNTMREAHGENNIHPALILKDNNNLKSTWNHHHDDGDDDTLDDPKQPDAGNKSPGCGKYSSSINGKQGATMKPRSASSPVNLLSWITKEFKHTSCQHGASCPVYCLQGFGQSFLALWVGQAALVTGLKVTSLRRDPSIIVRALTNRKKLNLCLFASLFTCIFRSVRCGLRWYTGRNESWHSLVAGLFAGPTMAYYPSPAIATNITWKCVEFAVDLGEKTGRTPSIGSIIPLLYGISVNLIFCTLVLYPNCLRPSYIRFIDQMTGHKLHQVNRGLLKLFGTDAHIGYEDFFPDVVPELCSPKFVESVLVWML